MALNKRYLKNIGLLGEEGQQKLFESRVAIVGAGGLGGTVFEILLRYGVGCITIIDFDAFEATNLNRQLLSSENNLGTNKAVAAAERARTINSGVEVVPIAQKITDANAERLLSGADCVCDCLGNIRDRFIVERAARGLGSPMVHAAIAGEQGQVMTVFPGDIGIEAIYGKESEAPVSGEEIEKGTPPSSVMAMASLQAHEAIKVLIGKTAMQGTVLCIDLSDYGMKKLKVEQRVSKPQEIS
jgi:molybdopterin/thiamine biosynthesis adenylyltransferase